uniref:Glutamyl-tRNA(Gln) amidotransferase subunit A, mitochondrial n=1 Tax=Glossina palpalis gambiensis TaxID=67801 RepID=A0A1B0C379_9MUSC
MRKYLPKNIIHLTNKFAEGSNSPLEVTKSAFNDAEKFKNLNAFIKLTKKLAYDSATESTHRYSEKRTKGPLDGVTIAIKDNFCTKGIHTTCASKMLEDFIPPYNATIYERLLNNGAILIGKTNMDEFAMGSGCVDSIYGPSKNIWSKNLENDEWRIAGGSSGGSALAVASGVCYASIGSDTGGSVRNPASYCGVIGLKPTYGLVSRHGLIPLVNSMDVPGIFARTVSDCTTILNCVSGPDMRDSTTIKMQYQPINLPLPEQIDISTFRVGVPKEYHCEQLSKDVLETWQKVAGLLENEGAIVKQVSLPHTAASIYVYSILNQCEVASNMAKYDGIEYGHRADYDCSTEELYAKSRAHGFNEIVKGRILAGNFFLLRKNYKNFFEKALKVRRLITEDFTKVFEGPPAERIDVLLTPTTLTEAPLYKEFITASNRDQCAVQDFCTQPCNMAGIPAISLPIRLSANGLPISLQIMSNKFNEKLLLTFARWLENQFEFNCLYNRELYEI